LEKKGVPLKYIKFIKEMYDKAVSSVREQVEESQVSFLLL